jgi:hypothetical protein
MNTLDPLRFASDALAELPEPEQATADVLLTLVATGEGLRRIVIAHGAELARLEYLIRYGARRAHLARELLELDWAMYRARLARERIMAYGRAAEAALNNDQTGEAS